MDGRESLRELTAPAAYDFSWQPPRCSNPGPITGGRGLPARRAPTSCSRRAALQLSAMTALLAGPLAPAGQALTPGQARTPYEEARRILLGPTKDK